MAAKLIACVLMLGAIASKTQAAGCLAVSVSVGHQSTCVLLSDGTVRCWGDNTYGQLGHADISADSILSGPPVDFGTGRSVKQLAVHAQFACALLDNNSVVCWGVGGLQELGVGDANSSQPRLAQLGTGNRTVQLLSTGCCPLNSCAAVVGVGVICWGRASSFQGTPWLGDPRSVGVNQGILPSKVDLGLERGKVPTVLDMCLGGTHTCVLTVERGLQCWGVGTNGQLGLGSVNDTSGFVGPQLKAVDLGVNRSAVQISCGCGHTCAVLDNGTLKCWGSNQYGQLGYGDTNDRGGKDTDMGDNLTAVDVGSGRTVKRVAAGGTFTCATLDNGDLKCWGENFWGQLGVPCPSQQQTWGGQPHQMGDNLTKVDLGPGRTAISVAGGFGSHTCAVLDDGSVRCWGSNRFGQLGFDLNTLLRTCVPLEAVDLGNNCTLSPGGNSSPDVINNSASPAVLVPGSPLSLLPPSPQWSPRPSSPTPPFVPGGTTAGVDITPPSIPSPEPSQHSVSIGAIAGPVVAGVVVIAVLAAGAWWWHAKRVSSSSSLAGAAAAAGGGDGGACSKHHSAHVMVVASDEVVATGHDEQSSLVQTTASDKFDAGGRTGQPSSTNSTQRDAMGTTTCHTPITGAATLALRSEGSSDDMSIPWSQLVIGKVLGEGGFGKVYKAKWMLEVVAVKLVNVRHASASAVASLYREALIMSKLRHPCIARVYGVVDEEPHHALVMQYYPQGTLAKYMTTDGYAGLKLATKIHIARQIASGMRFMHERSAPVLHGDLKTANILLTGPGRSIAIADFGLSHAMLASQEVLVASGALTYSISPPEVLNDPLAPRTRAADIYAFGIVLLEIINGQPAFRGLRASGIRALVTSGKRPPIPEGIPPCIVAIIEACWAQDPGGRPSFATVVEQLTAAYEDMQLTCLADGTTTVDVTHTLTDW